jgi:putative transcriptional regulator
MYSEGIGKKRSRFGRFLDENSITQQALAEKSRVSKSTISRLCDPANHEPTMKNARKIINALREAGYQVDYEDFWGV